METSPFIRREVALKLNIARPGKEKSLLAASLAELYGVNKNTVYSWAVKHDCGSDRKTRSDAGSSIISDEETLLMGAGLLACRRKSNHITADTPGLQEMFQDSGFGFNASPATINKRLREMRISKRDLTAPTPHMDMVSEHPNEWWSFDTTNCLMYFFDDKGLQERDLEMEFYKNKIENFKKIKKQIIRYVAVDHCSGAFFFWYYYASGEQVKDMADFVFQAMTPKEDDRYRFHGVPLNFHVDKSSVIHSGVVKNLLENTLKINVVDHLPGNPRAKPVESYQNLIQTKFECKLNFHTPVDINQLRAWALDWQIKFNALADIRETGKSRSQLWSFIKTDQLRLCPPEDVFRKLLRTKEIKRTVGGNLIIRFDGNKYRVPDQNLARREMEVSYNPYEYPAVEARDENGNIYLLEPINHDVFGRPQDGKKLGEYKALKHTRTQRAKVEMEKVLDQFGIGFKGTGDKRRSVAPKPGEEKGLQVFGGQAEKVGNLSFPNRAGMPIEAKVEIANVPILRVIKMVVAEIGPITKMQNQAIRQKYGSSVPENEIAGIIESLQGPVGRHLNNGKRAVGNRY